MSVLDMLARAEVSSDLQHHSNHCAVDVLGAAGMASVSNPAYMALFRVKFLNDASELSTAKSIFIRWARRAMVSRGLVADQASRIGSQALMKWLYDVCPACTGLGYQAIPGCPTLSDTPCINCGGTGKPPNDGKAKPSEVFRDIHDRADSVVRAIQGGIENKLGKTY
jgi:hypothetical protein